MLHRKLGLASGVGEAYGEICIVEPVAGLVSKEIEVQEGDKFEWVDVPDKRVLPVMTDWSKFLEDPRAIHQLER